MEDWEEDIYHQQLISGWAEQEEYKGKDTEAGEERLNEVDDIYLTDHPLLSAIICSHDITTFLPYHARQGGRNRLTDLSLGSHLPVPNLGSHLPFLFIPYR